MKKTALPIVAAIAASTLVAPAIAQAYPAGNGVCEGVAKWAGDRSILQGMNNPASGITLTAVDGAYPENHGPVTFPVASAADDVITFTGGMHVVMPQVDTTISDLKVLLNGTTAQLQGDYTATTTSGTTYGDDVILADINLFKPESTTHTVGFGNSKTVLTAEGSQAFGGVFAAGQQVMSFDVHGAWCGDGAGQPVVPAPTPAPETTTEETTTEAPAPETSTEAPAPAPDTTTEAPAPTEAPETSTEESTTDVAPTEEATPDQDSHHNRGPVYAAFHKLLHFLFRIFNGLFGGIFQLFGGLFR